MTAKMEGHAVAGGNDHWGAGEWEVELVRTAANYYLRVPTFKQHDK